MKNLNYAVKTELDDNGTLLVTCRDIDGVATFAEEEKDIIPTARDAIMVLLDHMVECGEDIPDATPPQDGEIVVPLSLQTQQKILLHRAMKARGWRMADLARALGVEHIVIRRLFDLHHNTTQRHFDAAAAALGLVGVVAFVPQDRLAA